MATEKQTKSNTEDPSPFGCLNRNPRKCRTCANSHGPAPWANGPDKSYCLAYERKLGNMKPDSVYFEGGDCPFYVKDEG